VGGYPAIRRSIGVHVRTQDFRGSKLLTCPTSTSEQLEQAQRSDDLVGAGTQRSDGQPWPYPSKSGRELSDVPNCLPTIPSDQTINRRARPDPGFPRLDVAHLPNFDLGATGAGPAIKTTWLAPVPSDQTVNRGRTGRRAVGNCQTCPPACRRSPGFPRLEVAHLPTCSPAQLRPLSNLSRPSDQTVNRGGTGRRAVGNCPTWPAGWRRPPR
jgi:hypothetical protein